jgi:hypothetical protein
VGGGLEWVSVSVYASMAGSTCHHTRDLIPVVPSTRAEAARLGSVRCTLYVPRVPNRVRRPAARVYTARPQSLPMLEAADWGASFNALCATEVRRLSQLLIISEDK